MKAFKTCDFILQLVVIAFIIIGTVVEAGTILAGLFILGGVQVLSFIIHLFLKTKPWISKLRKIYYGLLILPAAGVIYAMTVDPEGKSDMPEFEIMFYVGIISYLIGIFYFIITIIEWGRVNKQN